MTDIYFVKDGLLNGEPGVYASICGAPPPTTQAGKRWIQKDGWYYLPKDANDGIGPYLTKETAIEAAQDDE